MPLSAVPSDPLPPALRASYEFVRPLGAGAFAETWLIRRHDDDTLVVAKALRLTGSPDFTHLDRFRREARALASLRHPAIPALIETVEETAPEPGAPFLFVVQEYIEGRSLQQILDEGPMLGRDDVHSIAEQLLDVVGYLHDRTPAVLHRDIKPSNIILRPDGRLALIDFGGVTYGWQRLHETRATVVGTFGYMPPEQLLGQAGPRSDLYAIGATLLHLATGTPPDAFPFDSGRIEVPHDLPGGTDLRRLVAALLQPAPRDRPSDAAAARRLLEKPLADDATDARRGALVPVKRDGASPPILAIFEPDAPVPVDLGPPPRDPDGRWRTIYRNLVDCHNPLRDVEAPLSKFAGGLLYTLVGVATLGVLPALHLADRRQRRARFERLFRHGCYTEGHLLPFQMVSEEVRLLFRYDYVVDGRHYRGATPYPKQFGRYLGAGDRVGVLYDPEQPEHSCLVFALRKQMSRLES